MNGLRPIDLQEDNIRLLQLVARLNAENSHLSQTIDRLLKKEIKYKSPENDEDLAVIIDNCMKEYCELFPEGKWASSTELAMLIHRYFQDYRIALKEGDLSKEDFVNEDLESE